MESGAIIWITGFSGAGKTTVARKVDSLLRKSGERVVFLDGDDLRGIFGNKWGYEREERLELAHSYFRLCNTLVAQGLTVVISAVAMYEDIVQWVKTHVDRSLQVYLSVPETERRRRDQSTKRLYTSETDFSKLYDEPHAADLTIENYGEVSPAAAAEKIVEAFRRGASDVHSDKGREAHWAHYYAADQGIAEPSGYAEFVANRLRPGQAILEVGCGNGRDAAYFSIRGHAVTAIDASKAAIELCRRKHRSSGALFEHRELRAAAPPERDRFDVLYSRFCLHAMTESEETEMLAAAGQILKADGRLFLECRSINDPLARKGEVISPTERIFGHYRRFIVRADLHERLAAAGFAVTHSEESDNLAVLGDENPVVIRIEAINQRAPHA